MSRALEQGTGFAHLLFKRCFFAQYFLRDAYRGKRVQRLCFKQTFIQGLSPACLLAMLMAPALAIEKDQDTTTTNSPAVQEFGFCLFAFQRPTVLYRIDIRQVQNR
ncbi:hypothetical protein [Undibacterium sp. TC9W]|uniref:hypothetical protein n=1 Tax=Undibacterium sp. TC9W TaxID=3413053 RepID=UPI003BF1FA47